MDDDTTRTHETDDGATSDDLDLQTWFAGYGYEGREDVKVNLKRLSPDKTATGVLCKGDLASFPGRMPSETEIIDRWGGGEFKAVCMVWDPQPKDGRPRFFPKQRRTFLLPGHPKMEGDPNEASGGQGGGGQGGRGGGGGNGAVGDRAIGKLVDAVIGGTGKRDEVVEQLRTEINRAAAAQVDAADERAKRAEADRNRLMEEVEAIRKRMDDTSEQYQRRFGTFESTSLEAVRGANQDAQRAINEATAKAFERIAEERRQHEKELVALRDRHAVELSNLETRLTAAAEREAKRLETTNAMHVERIHALESDLRRADEKVRDLQTNLIEAANTRPDVFSSLGQLAQQKDALAGFFGLAPAAAAVASAATSEPTDWSDPNAMITAIRAGTDLVREVMGGKKQPAQRPAQPQPQPAPQQPPQVAAGPAPAAAPQERIYGPQDLKPGLELLAQAYSNKTEIATCLLFARPHLPDDLVEALAREDPAALTATLGDKDLLVGDLNSPEGRAYTTEFLTELTKEARVKA